MPQVRAVPFCQAEARPAGAASSAPLRHPLGKQRLDLYTGRLEGQQSPQREGSPVLTHKPAEFHPTQRGRHFKQVDLGHQDIAVTGNGLAETTALWSGEEKVDSGGGVDYDGSHLACLASLMEVLGGGTRKHHRLVIGQQLEPFVKEASGGSASRRAPWASGRASTRRRPSSGTSCPRGVEGRSWAACRQWIGGTGERGRGSATRRSGPAPRPVRRARRRSRHSAGWGWPKT